MLIAVTSSDQLFSLQQKTSPLLISFFRKQKNLTITPTGVGPESSAKYSAKGPSMYCVSVILNFFSPTHYVSLNTVLNVRKTGHFLNSPSPLADAIYGWQLTTLFLNHLCRSKAGRGFTILLIEACLKEADSSLVFFSTLMSFHIFHYFRMVASQQQLGCWRARCGLHT